MASANGPAELRALAVRCRAVGARDLRLELLRGLRLAAQPLIPAVKDAARRQLPKSGGLNEQVASQKVSVSVRTGAATAGVRLTTTAPDTKQTDSGYVRHPVFGRWLPNQPDQKIPQAVGWWSKTLGESAPTVTPVLLATIRRIGVKVMGR